MITPEQLAAESEALTKLLDDPRFQSPGTPSLIALVINELAWVNDGEAMPASQILINDLEQGLI
jgi:hypothetical protein